MKRKIIRKTINVVILLAVAFCCRYVNIAETYFEETNVFMQVIYPTIKSMVRHTIHISLVLAWCISIYIRILDHRVRNFMLSVGLLIMLWFLIRIIKWDFVMSYEDPWVRYLWYAYYIPIVLLPLQGVFIAALVGREETYKIPRWMWYLYIPAVLLIITVFTNDLHRRVFSFPAGVTYFDRVYEHESLYFVVLLWVIVLLLYFFAALLKKSRVSGRKKYQKLPLLVLLGFIAVWFIHTLNLFPNDQTVLNCFLAILFLESQIQTGLIRSNSHYEELFQQSTIAAKIIDHNYEICHASKSSGDMELNLPEQIRKDDVLKGEMHLNSKPISGGYILWKDDIREIHALLEQLQETQDQLQEDYDLKQEEIRIKERKTQAEEKSRLYDRIAQEVSPQLLMAEQILTEAKKDPERRNEGLARICVLSAYIKRLGNLLMISEEAVQMPAAELESCIRESMDNLRIAGVLTFFDSRCDGDLDCSDAIALYQLFEKAVEYFLDTMNAMVVTLQYKDGTTQCCLQIGCSINIEEIEIPRFSIAGGQVITEMQDNDLVVSVNLKKRGYE